MGGRPIKFRELKQKVTFPWRKRYLERLQQPSRRNKVRKRRVKFAENSLWTRAYEMLLCVLLFGKYWEMGMTVMLPRTLAITDLHSRDGNFIVLAPSEHKLYSEAKYTAVSKTRTVLAVPRVLAERKFALSDRLWLLEAVVDEYNSKCWRVLEKVALVGCGTIIHDQRTVFLARDQRVIG